MQIYFNVLPYQKPFEHTSVQIELLMYGIICLPKLILLHYKVLSGHWSVLSRHLRSSFVIASDVSLHDMTCANKNSSSDGN